MTNESANLSVRSPWRRAFLSPVGSALAGAVIGVSAAALMLAASGARRRASLEVRTVPLHRLTADAAVALVTPYITAEGGAVFQSPGVTAITIRERPDQIDQIQQVLGVYDGQKAPVLLHFELVVAGDTVGVASGLAPLEAVLASAIPHSGLRRVGDAVLTASVGQDVEQSLGAGASRLIVRVRVLDTPVDSSGLVRIRVSGRLPEASAPAFDSEIGIAFRNTTVLGSASLLARGHPLILSVRATAVSPTVR